MLQLWAHIQNSDLYHHPYTFQPHQSSQTCSIIHPCQPALALWPQKWFCAKGRWSMKSSSICRWLFFSFTFSNSCCCCSWQGSCWCCCQSYTKNCSVDKTQTYKTKAIHLHLHKQLPICNDHYHGTEHCHPCWPITLWKWLERNRWILGWNV